MLEKPSTFASRLIALTATAGLALSIATGSAFADAGVDALELSTDDNLIDAILRFADLRRRRRQLAAGGGFPQHLRGMP